MKCFGQEYLFGQVFGIERLKLVQCLDHFRCDALWFAVPRPAMHYAMPYGCQLTALDSFLDPIHQHLHRRRVVRRSD